MKNFVVVANKRTGSTFLQEALSSHPQIKCWDELFLIRGAQKTGKRRGQYLYRYMKNNHKYNIKDYIEGIHNTDPDKSIGFRLMYPQNDYWNALDTIMKSKTPIIHLVRENLLSVVLSKKTKGLFEVKKIQFDPKNIVDEMNSIEKKYQQYYNKLKNHKNLITLKYEEIIGRTEGEKGETQKFGAFNLKSDMKTYVPMDISERICNFLDVEPMELYCNVTKKNSPDPGDYIKNKDEIKSVLKSEGYSKGVK